MPFFITETLTTLQLSDDATLRAAGRVWATITGSVDRYSTAPYSRDLILSAHGPEALLAASCDYVSRMVPTHYDSVVYRYLAAVGEATGIAMPPADLEMDRAVGRARDEIRRILRETLDSLVNAASAYSGMQGMSVDLLPAELERRGDSQLASDLRYVLAILAE